jgi:hypothetical protein
LVEKISLWLKKYARTLNPNLPENIRKMLENYLVDIAKHGVRGLPRRLDALERVAIGFAKLKLKDSVDEEDVLDTIALFNEILKFYKQAPPSLRDTTFLYCINELQKNSPQKWGFDDLIQEVCRKNPDIDSYIGKIKKTKYNWKMKAVQALLDKHPSVRRVSEKPIVYVWVDEEESGDIIQESGNNDNNIISEHLGDVRDARDDQNQKGDTQNSSLNERTISSSGCKKSNGKSIKKPHLLHLLHLLAPSKSDKCQSSSEEAEGM